MSFEKMNQQNEVDPGEVNRVLAEIEITRSKLAGYGNHDSSEFAVLDTAYQKLLAGDISPAQAEQQINEMFNSKNSR